MKNDWEQQPVSSYPRWPATSAGNALSATNSYLNTPIRRRQREARLPRLGNRRYFRSFASNRGIVRNPVEFGCCDQLQRKSVSTILRYARRVISNSRELAPLSRRQTTNKRFHQRIFSILERTSSSAMQRGAYRYDRVPRRERWILEDPQFHPREFVPCRTPARSSVDKSFGVISRRRVALNEASVAIHGASVALPEMHQRSLPSQQGRAAFQ